MSYRVHVTVHDDGTWSYEEEGVAHPDREDLFSHIDRNTLTRIGLPEPNPCFVPLSAHVQPQAVTEVWGYWIGREGRPPSTDHPTRVSGSYARSISTVP